MLTIFEIEDAVINLPEDRKNEFRKWFAQYDSNEWDTSIEQDQKIGRLKNMAQQAKLDFENGAVKKYESLYDIGFLESL